MAPEFGFASEEHQKAFMEWVNNPENAQETDYGGDTHSGWDIRVWDVNGEPLDVKISSKDGLPLSVFTGKKVSNKILSAGIELREVETE